MRCRDTKLGEFVRSFMACMKRPTGIDVLNAGHPAVGAGVAGGKADRAAEHEHGAGRRSDRAVTQSIVDLQPGDFLMLYTDGLSDAMNFQGETFGGSG